MIIDDCKTMKFKDPKVKEIFMCGRHYQVMYRPTNALSGTDGVEQKVTQDKVEEKKADSIE